MKASFLRLSLALRLIATAKIVFGMPGKKPRISMLTSSQQLMLTYAYICLHHNDSRIH